MMGKTDITLGVCEQLPMFPDIPVMLWDGRRFLGRATVMGSGGMTADVRMSVFRICRRGFSVTTALTGHKQSRVRSAFRVLERERMVELGKMPCRNPHGYRLVARLHPRLKHLLFSLAEEQGGAEQ